jgi:hypothetical protein
MSVGMTGESEELQKEMVVLCLLRFEGTVYFLKPYQRAASAVDPLFCL